MTVEQIGATFAVLFLAACVVFVALGGIWMTGILMPIATVRWCLQLDAVVIVTLLAATIAAAICQ